MIEQHIPTIISTAVSIITTITAVLCNKSKGKKQKLVELAKIAQKLPIYILEAEQIFGKGTVSAKLAYTLNKIQMDCIANKVTYNENQWKGEIENTLATPQKKDMEESKHE